MTPELKMIDASYAEDLKDLLRHGTTADLTDELTLGLNIIYQALIKMGLKETARQFTKLIKKI